MATEIEKKYLLREGGNEYPTEALIKNFNSVESLAQKILAEGAKIRQGYLDLEKGKNLAEMINLSVEFEPNEARLRERTDDKGIHYYFTIKGDGGLSRLEVEAGINAQLFGEFWPETEKKRIEKMGLKLPYMSYNAEFEIYLDRNLIIAEIEVPSIEDAEKLIPLGKDVTEDKKYKNKNLAKPAVNTKEPEPNQNP